MDEAVSWHSRVGRLAARMVSRWENPVRQRMRSQGEMVMVSLSIVVGVATGLLAAALISVVRVVQAVAFGPSVSGLTLIAVPTLGALLVGVLVTLVIPESSGGGVVEVVARISTHGCRLRRRVPVCAVLASGLALGTGGAGGREGPIVLIGGSVGSVIGRLFSVDEERMRALVAAGVAAGIGASFHAPIGGMLFAIELIIGAFRRTALQAIVVASVISSVTARLVIGPDIIYRSATPRALEDPRHLALYGVLGFAAALVGLGFLYGEDLSRRAFRRLAIWPPLRLAIGGLCVGVLALAVPEVIGTGDHLPPIDGMRDPIRAMLDGQGGTGSHAVGFLLVLAVAKLVATCLSVGSGNAVGTFAPALFCGAALGGAVGHAADMLVPAAELQPGAFALVGMAAVFAAAARMPLTAIVIAIELTDGYDMVLPLMLAAGLATFVAGRVHPESVYTLPLRQRGIAYVEPDHAAITQVVRVGELMTTDPRALERLDVGSDNLSTVAPDDPLARAVRQMATDGADRLAVMSPDGDGRFLGVVRRSDVMRAYHQVVAPLIALQRKMQDADDPSELHILEMPIDADAPAAGRRLRDVPWPAGTILAYVRRGFRGIVPRGDTQLRAGDTVTVLTSRSRVHDVRCLLQRTPQSSRQPQHDGDPVTC